MKSCEKFSIPFDKEKRDAILLEGGLKKAEEGLKALAYVWFGEQEHAPLTKNLEEYTLKGGVYGSVRNVVAAQASKRGKGIKYIMSRIWFPYNLLRLRYPKVEKCKLLIPYYQICRWLRFLFKGKKKLILEEAKEVRKLSDERAEGLRMMFEELGLESVGC